MRNPFYVDVELVRHKANAVAVDVKRVPYVNFYHGYNLSYMDMRMFGVYWKPRSPCHEGEELYEHYFKIYWRPLFRFSWR